MTPRVQAATAELIEALAEAVRMEAGTDPAAPDRLLSVDEASATLSLGRSKVYDLISRGELKTIAIGRRRLVPMASIAAFIAEHAA